MFLIQLGKEYLMVTGIFVFHSEYIFESFSISIIRECVFLFFSL